MTVPSADVLLVGSNARSNTQPSTPMTPVPWSSGRWENQPVEVREDGADLLVTCAEGSDAWRVTSYGFIHDTEHALVRACTLLATAVAFVMAASVSDAYGSAIRLAVTVNGPTCIGFFRLILRNLNSSFIPGSSGSP